VNASLWSANAVTHAKIVAISLAASTLLAIVGIAAELSVETRQAAGLSATSPAAPTPKSGRDLRRIKPRSFVVSQSQNRIATYDQGANS
jgi:hypothetical protein